MPRPRKGVRLYLRKGRIDRRSGRALPDTWFIVDGPREVGTGFTQDRLGEAERALAAYIAERDAPAAATPAASRGDSDTVLIAEVLTYYAEERAPELDSEADTIAGYLAKLGEWWALKTVSEVKRSSCKAYVTWRTSQTNASFTKNPTDKKVSDQTARRELEELSSAIGFWDGEYKLDRRPSVWLPDKRESPRDALTRSQAALLLLGTMGWQKQADGSWKRLPKAVRANRMHLRRLVLMGLYTGTRSKVKRLLLWEEAALQAWVDLDRGMIFRRGKAERDRPNKRRPVVNIPDRLLAHMRRWRRMDLAAEALRRKGDKKTGRKPDPNYRLVSVMHFGGAPIAGPARTGFASCVADGGLPAEITPHWLRHTCATWLMIGGAKLWDASGFTGMSPTMLETNYGHHHPDFQKEAKEASGGRRRAPALQLVSRE